MPGEENGKGEKIVPTNTEKLKEGSISSNDTNTDTYEEVANEAPGVENSSGKNVVGRYFFKSISQICCFVNIFLRSDQEISDKEGSVMDECDPSDNEQHRYFILSNSKNYNIIRTYRCWFVRMISQW